tara:strand:+ start:679 stop:1560 length:882 start_codon:yes stop_codon:yes gene_type:complete
MKGIVLAGGSGTRLYPITKGISKQLLSIYDKPMIYYPISILMLSGIREILIISTPQDIDQYKRLLGNGSLFGLNLSYRIQPNPSGLAEAFIIGEDFIENDDVALVLGDNVFYGHGFSEMLISSVKSTVKEKRANIFGYYVPNPDRYGIVEFDKNFNALSIQEKPEHPKSNYAVVGLYFYPNDVIEIAKKITPSNRGELEISAINQEFLNQEKLFVKILGRGFTWLDTGTHDSLLEASNFIKTIENHAGFKVACLEEIAFNKGYIGKDKLLESIETLGSTNYGNYLKNLLDENN